MHANAKVIVFDTYDTTQSLKDNTRITRKKQRPVPPWNFIISLETDIEKILMDELLASKTTRHSMNGTTQKGLQKADFCKIKKNGPVQI